MTPSIEDRWERAEAALDAYRQFTGDVEDESHFSDLLLDMMHLASRDGKKKFDEQLERARRAFEFET